MTGHVSKDSVFRDFCDGNYIKNTPLFQHDNALCVSFYYDELEVANPLGSKRGKHKLGIQSRSALFILEKDHKGLSFYVGNSP